MTRVLNPGREWYLQMRSEAMGTLGLAADGSPTLDPMQLRCLLEETADTSRALEGLSGDPWPPLKEHVWKLALGELVRARARARGLPVCAASDSCTNPASPRAIGVAIMNLCDDCAKTKREMLRLWNPKTEG